MLTTLDILPPHRFTLHPPTCSYPFDLLLLHHALIHCAAASNGPVRGGVPCIIRLQIWNLSTRAITHVTNPTERFSNPSLPKQTQTL